MLLDPVELAVGGELRLVRGQGGGVLKDHHHHTSIVEINYFFVNLRSNLPNIDILVISKKCYAHLITMK